MDKKTIVADAERIDEWAHEYALEARTMIESISPELRGLAAASAIMEILEHAGLSDMTTIGVLESVKVRFLPGFAIVSAVERQSRL